MTTKDILTRARELYASAPSHAPASEMPPAGTYCAVSALSQAAPGATEKADMAIALSDALFALRDVTRAWSIVGWNARASTEEVLAAFDRAIARQCD